MEHAPQEVGVRRTRPVLLPHRRHGRALPAYFRPRGSHGAKARRHFRDASSLPFRPQPGAGLGDAPVVTCVGRGLALARGWFTPSPQGWLSPPRSPRSTRGPGDTAAHAVLTREQWPGGGASRGDGARGRGQPPAGSCCSVVRSHPEKRRPLPVPPPDPVSPPATARGTGTTRGGGVTACPRSLCPAG